MVTPTKTFIKSPALLLAWTSLAALTIFFFLPPIAQDPEYHNFADRRAAFGVPHFLNVISNLPFAAVGAMGLWTLLKAESIELFLDRRERWPYIFFFAGVALTSIGSSYYHLTPTTGRLFWDRLPMTLGFMSIFAAVIAERINLKTGLRLLGPLLAVGLVSVLYWRVTEASGAGDLRLYAVVQFYPLVAIPVMLAMFAPRYTRGADLIASLAIYGAAKLFELADAWIFYAGKIVSGHSLKHVAAALSALVVLRMLKKRRPATTKPIPLKALS
jgi:hypothetical protein